MGESDAYCIVLRHIFFGQIIDKLYIKQSNFICISPIHNKSHPMTFTKLSRFNPYSLINCCI